MVQSCRQAFQRNGNPVRTALLRRWAGGQVLSLPRTGTTSSNCQVGSTGRHNRDSWLWILPCLSTLVLASPQALQKCLQHQNVHSFVYSSLKHFVRGRKTMSLSMPWRHIAGWEVFLHSFLTLALAGRAGSEWVLWPSHFTPGGKKLHGTNWTGGRMDPRDSLEVLGKRKISCPWPESNPGLPSQSDGHYTNYAILAWNKNTKWLETMECMVR